MDVDGEKRTKKIFFCMAGKSAEQKQKILLLWIFLNARDQFCLEYRTKCQRENPQNMA